MTITITQKCDRCKVVRPLSNVSDKHSGGWREVAQNKHLCAKCITYIVEDGEEE